jgi:fructose-bisphosphate aldolase, class II
MTSLRQVLERAQSGSTAVGHFNVADLVLLKAVFGAARLLKTPILIGVSEVAGVEMAAVRDPVPG